MPMDAIVVTDGALSLGLNTRAQDRDQICIGPNVVGENAPAEGRMYLPRTLPATINPTHMLTFNAGTGQVGVTRLPMLFQSWDELVGEEFKTKRDDGAA